MTCSCCDDQKCFCEQLFQKNKEKRTLRNYEKLESWKVRNNPRTAANKHVPSSKSEHSAFDLLPDAVTKTSSKLKFGNKKYTSSRYHWNFLNRKPKPKHLIKSNLKRNVLTEACKDCPCTSQNDEKEKFKNECYCGFPPNKPTLPGKPDFTVPNKHGRHDTTQIHIKSPPHKHQKSTFSLDTLKMAKDLLDYMPQSEFLCRMRREADNIAKCRCNPCKLKAEAERMQYTDRRMKLENAYKEYEEESNFGLNHLSRFNKSGIDNASIKCNFSNLKSGSGSLGNASMNCNRSTVSDKIHAVKHIRQHNYFDTHAVGKVKEKDSHKCVFKFTTDDRGLLKPLNPDAYGTNRCCICNRAMEEDTARDTFESITCPSVKTIQCKSYNIIQESNEGSESKEIIVSKENDYEKFEESELNNISMHPEAQAPINNNSLKTYNGISLINKNQIDDIGNTQKQMSDNKLQKKKITSVLAPRKISVPSNKEIIEVNLLPGPSLMSHTKLNVKYSPANSWALRFQKGVL